MLFTSDLLPLIGFGMSSSFYIHGLGDLCSRVRSSGEILNPPISVQSTVESSFQLSSSVYLRRCRTALVGYMLDQSNFLMCVT